MIEGRGKPGFGWFELRKTLSLDTLATGTLAAVGAAVVGSVGNYWTSILGPLVISGMQQLAVSIGAFAFAYVGSALRHTFTNYRGQVLPVRRRGRRR